MTRRHDLLKDAAQLVGLVALAVAQPLFRVSSENPTYFAAHKMSGGALLAFALLTVLLPSAVLFAGRAIVGLVSKRAGEVVQAVFVALLAAMVIWSPFARSIKGPLVAIALYAVIAALICLAFLRAKEVRTLIAVSAVAAPVVIGLFLLSPAVRGFTSSATPPSPDTSDAKRNPVVMVVFDEFPVGSLLTDDDEVDAVRYPNFGELSETATWYRNMSTNGIWTRVSVPIISSGRFDGTFVPGGRPPIAANYPRSLFTMLAGSRQMHVGELATQVCPATICETLNPEETSTKTLVADTTILYLHSVLPAKLTEALPPVNNTWSGFLRSKALVPEYFAAMPQPLRAIATRIFLPFAPADERGELNRFQEFTASFGDYDEDALHYLHVKLPHRPWALLPSLQTSRETSKARKGAVDLAGAADDKDTDELNWPKNKAAVDSSLQQHLLQVKAVDTLLGQLIDEIKRTGDWDDTLFIATADHGVSFHPGGSRRTDTEVSAEDIVRTPLFVKYPGQDSGDIDDRDAQAMDIVPTIVDVLDVDVDWNLPGTSLRAKAPKGRRKLVISAHEIHTYPTEQGAFRSLPVQIAKLFGAGRERDDIFAWGPHADLVGTNVDEDVADSDISARIGVLGAFRRVDPDAETIPSRINAVIDPGDRSDDREIDWVAVAVNDRIAGVAQVIKRDRWLVQAMLSPRYLNKGRNEVRLFVVNDAELEEIEIIRTARAAS